MEKLCIAGQIVNIRDRSIHSGEIIVEEGIISEIRNISGAPGKFITPGFVDAHVHIESSMLIPSEFARLASVHGTVATVSDPHEIGNVLGVEGVLFMIANSKKVNFKCFFGAPSCVPATPFETAGAIIDSDGIESLLRNPDIHYLAEMMNWPGVLEKQPEVIAKINMAHQLRKPVDGHAPGLRGEQARQYIQAGISTDHECFTKEEAFDKLKWGMKIIIREGSAAKNFEALIDLLPQYVDQVMFCSDDKHPDNLVEGHINLLMQRGVQHGIDPLVLLQVATKNPVDHYGLNVGLLQVGDPADFLVLNNLEDFQVEQTYINGIKVAENGTPLIEPVPEVAINYFETEPKTAQEFQVAASGKRLRVMVAEDGQLVTKSTWHQPLVKDGWIISDPANDVLKITVVNRYANTPPAVAFVKNFGFNKGAIASSVAHDSHNIIAVGVDDEAIAQAVNAVINVKGGVAAVDQDNTLVLPLPVAGLMSCDDGYEVAKKYTKIDRMAKSMGSTLQSPFMTLSFMALLVIPEVKLSDQGLFDGTRFEFVNLVED